MITRRAPHENIAGITIEHLLMHTGGGSNDRDDPMFSSRNQRQGVEQGDLQFADANWSLRVSVAARDVRYRCILTLGCNPAQHKPPVVNSAGHESDA